MMEAPQSWWRHPDETTVHIGSPVMTTLGRPSRHTLPPLTISIRTPNVRPVFTDFALTDFRHSIAT